LFSVNGAPSTRRDVAFDQPAQDRHEPAEHDLQAPQVERQAGAVCNSAPLRLRR
jgi:hypothetical protein